MKISRQELCDLMIEVARKRFGQQTFGRRALMNATEREVKRRGLWTSEDDVLSQSRGEKSIGLANIDYTVSNLKESGALIQVCRDRWRLC